MEKNDVVENLSSNDRITFCEFVNVTIEESYLTPQSSWKKAIGPTLRILPGFFGVGFAKKL